MPFKVNRSDSKSSLSSSTKKKKKADQNFFSELLGINKKNSPNKSSENEKVDSISSVKNLFDQELIEDLDNLIDEIDSASVQLKAQPIYTNLVKYKFLIQQLLDKVIKNSYKIEEKVGRKSLTEEKLYITVKKINSELEKLAEDILNKQVDTINLVKKLDEIRGILIDIYK